jgi:hypothetical protein
MSCKIITIKFSKVEIENAILNFKVADLNREIKQLKKQLKKELKRK